MIPCDSRQTVVNRSTGLTVLRCINNDSPASGQQVEEEACALCPVRNYVRSECPGCKQATARALEETHVETGSSEEVIEMLSEAGMDMALEQFDTEPVAEGELPPDYPPMSLQLWLYKEALLKWQRAGRPTRSEEEVKRIHETLCNPPGEPCAWYDSEKKRCKGCGCKVSTSSMAVLNKIKMATEHCPLEKW